MKKRMISFILAAALVFCLVPVRANAEDSGLGMRLLGSGESYTDMTTSQNMVDMIKDLEGFRATPYWDVNQWSIGYGSSCGTDRNNKPDLTVTEEEAEEMLVKELAETYGKKVNKYCASIGRQPSQQQFDALVDFTYNLGSGWTSGCMLTTWLKNPTTEMDFVNAIGRWGRVSSQADYYTCTRRIREAIVFLHGEYYLRRGDGNFETELETVSDKNLPYYKVVIFQGNGGTLGNLTNEIHYYAEGATFGSFEIPEREGYAFSGYRVTKVNNSSVTPYSISVDDVATDHLELTAVWTEGTEVTEPEETEPVETEPEETEPVETEPVETEPEETEPEETEPVETEPVETEPEETEPEDQPPQVDTQVELPFRDVPEKCWYRAPVEFVYQNGYMSGTSENTFSPSQNVTRGMLVMVLYRIAGSPEVSEEDEAYFSDTQGKYYTTAVGWAKANGIVSGISKSRFGPDNRITRQDAMTIFYRYCVDYLGMDGTCSGDLSDFGDSDRVSGYARNPISWAVDVGLMSGTTGSSGVILNPRGNLTRAEAATIFRALVLKVLESI